MEVLHTSRFGPPRVGGTEQFIKDCATNIARYGLRSTHLYSSESGFVRTPIHCDRDPACISGYRPYPVRTRGVQRMMFPDRLSLMDACRMADVVHVHDIRFGLKQVMSCSRTLGLPVIISTHGLIFHQSKFDKTKRLVWQRHVVPLLRSATMVLAVSGQDLQICADAGIEHNLLHWPNPVNLSRFSYEPPVAANSVKDRISVLYFGRLDRNKNLDSLVNLARHEGVVQVKIVGSGDAERARLVAIVREADLCDRVEILGGLSDADLAGQIASSDCLVFPSSYEGFGLTLVEGLASGRPIVASDIAPFRQILKGLDIELVNVNVAPLLMAAIRRAMNDYPIQAALARAQEFDWTRRAPELVGIYRDVVAGNAVAPR